jgi:hypothetical protein
MNICEMYYIETPFFILQFYSSIGIIMVILKKKKKKKGFGVILCKLYETAMYGIVTSICIHLTFALCSLLFYL